MAHRDPITQPLIDLQLLTDALHACRVVGLDPCGDRTDSSFEHPAERHVVEHLDAGFDRGVEPETPRDHRVGQRSRIAAVDPEVRVAESDPVNPERQVKVFELIDDRVDAGLPPRRALDEHVRAHRAGERTPATGLDGHADAPVIACLAVPFHLE